MAYIVQSRNCFAFDEWRFFGPYDDITQAIECLRIIQDLDNRGRDQKEDGHFVMTEDALPGLCMDEEHEDLEVAGYCWSQIVELCPTPDPAT